MPRTFYEAAWIFFIYAFLGWCTEVSYAALDRGIFVNRGFLNGPYCPIYGCGVLIVIELLTPLKSNLAILFLGSFLLTSILEYIVGYVLEKVFHNKWWDYSDKPFNIRGYVCLKFSVFWGLACTFILLIIHPAVYHFVRAIPRMLGNILLAVMASAFSADCVVTVNTILKFNRRLRLMGEIAEKLKEFSNDIGENIYENVTDAMEQKENFEEAHQDLINDLAARKSRLAEDMESGYQRLAENVESGYQRLTENVEGGYQRLAENVEGGYQKLAENVEDSYQRLAENVEDSYQRLAENVEGIQHSLENRKAEYEELSRKYRELAEKKIYGHDRLLRAFPGMKSRDNEEALKKLREHLKKLRKNH